MKTYIIAEAGVNHNGELELAKKLIESAAKIGASAVKFQSFKANLLASKHAQKATYQKQNSNSNETQLAMLKKLELSEQMHYDLLSHCKAHKIEFLSTPFDLESVDLLDKLGLRIFKIASGEITNLPYLRKIGALKKRVFLSTGMANLGEIEAALNVLIKAGTKLDDIVVLQANTQYPTPFVDVNLKALETIKSAFKVKVGYSDHTKGIEAAIGAVALGACVIEKHFTLDKNMSGPDHKASLEPDEFEQMIKAIKNIEAALGSGVKKASESETPNINIARKSIVASKNIKKGEILNESNLSTKRPANGICPMRWDEVINTRAKRDFSEDEMIEI